MPLPAEPTTLHGGCFCRAIRYKVDVPTLADRPIYPAGGADVDPPVHLPVICTDHCGDCRPATGSILPCWLLCATRMVSFGCEPVARLSRGGRLDADAERTGEYQSAESLLAENEAVEGTTLVQFASSKNRRRLFCSRCGTMFGYRAVTTAAGAKWPAMLDLVLGTVDAADLEGKQLMPERQLWWDSGIGWIKEMARHGLGERPVHPKFFLSEGAAA